MPILMGIQVTADDVKSIKNDWLTDNAISFWQEYLEREKLIDYPRTSIILLRPAMSTMIFLTQGRTGLDGLRSNLPNFEKTTHIFLPINDNRNANQAEGGSHWSLLLVCVGDGSAFHYDSLGGSNEVEAQDVAKKLGYLLGRQLRFVPMDDCPVQENGSDCGVFVCLIMQHLLLNRLLKTDSEKKISMSMAGREINATKGRKAMLQKIEEERKKQRKEATSRSRSTSRDPRSDSRSPLK